MGQIQYKLQKNEHATLVPVFEKENEHYGPLMQEDYEIFKGQMEEKADRQDGMASAIEDAQARLEEAEANIVHLTEETETSGQDVQASTYRFAHLPPLYRDFNSVRDARILKMS